jgi:regulation of enolase protein 1 (concanavalin A-like superfamily)
LISHVFTVFLPFITPITIFAADAVPAPWQGVDVGNVGLPGSSSLTSNGFLMVNGAGSDIWGTADSFHFVYQSSFHDGTVDTDPAQQDATHPFAKAGLMIRQSLDPGSPHVMVDVKPDGGIEFMTRQTPGGPTTFVAGGRINARLQLIRRNGTVTALTCPYGQLVACTTIGSAPFPSGPALVGVVVTSHDPSTLNHTTFGRGEPGPGMPRVFTLPALWSSFDVGAVGVTGSAFVDDGTFTIKGAGADVWGTSDSFHIVGTLVSNDSEVVARVTSQDGANTFAKAGVIMRTGTWIGGTGPGTDTPTVILDIRPNGIVEFMARPSKGAPMQFVAGSASPFPAWLKLERRGSQVTGLVSQDGTQWSTVGITSVSMSGEVTTGLAVTSHDTAVLNTATFDHVLVSGVFPTFDEDIGDVGIAGGYWVSPDGLYAPVYGSGADIWGTTDAFHWQRSALIDDGQLSVKVSRPATTTGSAVDPFAKAGVMIRESPDPSSANVILDVRPDGSIEFMARNTYGAPTTFIATASAPNPVWLKLARNGLTITGFISADGSTWIPVGTASPSIDSMALIGIVVTSHRRGELASAAFSQLSR